nr:TRAP transporter large permease subunit [Alteribacillus bidgolensis]
MMGAAAFVLAEVMQINYVIVATAAIIPAILFCLGLWASVHFEAKKLNLKLKDAKDMPHLKDVFLKGEALTLFVPMFVLILLLVYWLYTSV